MHERRLITTGPYSSLRILSAASLNRLGLSRMSCPTTTLTFCAVTLKRFQTGSRTRFRLCSSQVGSRLQGGRKRIKRIWCLHINKFGVNCTSDLPSSSSGKRNIPVHNINSPHKQNALFDLNVAYTSTVIYFH